MSASVSRTSWTGGIAPPALGVPDGPRASWHLLSVREVAAACQLSEKAVRRAIDAGELPAVKLRSRVRVTPKDLETWIESSRQRSQRPTLSPATSLPRRPP